MSTQVKENDVKEKEVIARDTVSIEIKIVHHTRKEDGKPFEAYKVLDKNGFWIDCKFKKVVKNLPTEHSIMICKVEDVQYLGKDRVKYPHIWVSGVVEYKELYNPEADVNGDNLPF